MIIGSLLALTMAVPAPADPLPGADITSIHSWLTAHNPKLRARDLEAQAAAERIQPAGALPDPMLSIELREIDRDRPLLLSGQVGSTLYEVEQQIPLWGKRGLARDIAQDEAAAAGLMRDATALELKAAASAAYIRYWHAFESIQIVARVIDLMEDLQRLAESRYSAGLAVQQDAIKAQVETTMMRRESIERRAMGFEAAAALNTLLGREPQAPLTTPIATPNLPVRLRLDEMLDRLDARHPMLQSQQRMAAAAERMAEMVRRERYPDLNVGLGLMQIDDRFDSWELMFEFEIPLQRSSRRHRERESLLLRDAALARAQSALAQLRGEIGEAWVRWESAREQGRLIDHTLLPQAKANFDSALTSYQVGGVDFGTLLDALREWRGADLDRLDALRDELIAAAQLRAIQGDQP